jgi:hypothetical protein
LTTTETKNPRKARPAPDDWKPGLTRVKHTDNEHGTYVGPSLPLPQVKPHSWLGVLVQFDGSPDHVDVDPADLTVIHLRDPFAAIANQLPTRYAPGDTAAPYHFPAENVWNPVIYYAAGEVVKGEGPIWLVEPYPAARADGTDGLDPVDGAGVAVLCGAAAPRPRTADRDGDWIIPGKGLIEHAAYDVYVGNQRDLLAAWMEAWAIAAALNGNMHRGLGLQPVDIEVLLAAERRALIGDSRFVGTVNELRWTEIGDDFHRPRRVPVEQVARLRGGQEPLIEACAVVDKRPELPMVGPGWQETTYQLTRVGVETLLVIRHKGFEQDGPRCRVCGCTGERACPNGCGWQNGVRGLPLCSACPA